MAFLPPIIQELRVVATEAIAEWAAYGDAATASLEKAAAAAEAQATRMEATADEAATKLARTVESTQLQVDQLVERSQVQMDAAIAKADAAEAELKAQAAELDALFASETASADEVYAAMARVDAAEASMAKAATAANEQMAASTLAISQAAERAALTCKVVSEDAVAANEAAAAARAEAVAAAAAVEESAAADASAMTRLKSVADTALLATTAGLAAVGYEGVKMATQFDSAMEMLHTQAQVPQKDVDDLKGKVLDLAGKVGVSGTQLADALYHIESSFQSVGITGSNAMHLLQIAAEGAKTGHADLVSVTNALDAAIASGIPGVQNYDQAMGALNATVGAGDMKMQDLANAFSTGFLATVKGFGLSLRDVSSALAVFGDNNIRGSMAGTQLRMSVQAMAVPMSTSADALKKLNLAHDSLAIAMQHGGLTAALQMLVDHLHAAGITSDQTAQIITEAFGRKAGTGLNILVDQFERYKSKLGDVDKASAGFANDWAAQQATLKQEWDEAKAGIEALVTEIGLKLIPILQAALGFFEQHTTVLKVLVGAVLGVVGVLAAYAAVMKTIEAVQIVVTVATRAWAAAMAILDLVMDANPIMLVVIAIAALVAGIIYAYTHVKWFHDAVNDLGNFLKTVFVDAFNAAKTAIVDAWNFIKTAVTDGVNVVKTIINDLENAWNTTWSAIKTVVADAVDWITQHWDQIRAAISPLLVAIGLLEAGWKAAWDAIKTAVTDAYNWIVQEFDQIKTAVTGTLQTAITDLENVWNTAWTAIKNAVTDAYNWIKQEFDQITSAVLPPLKTAITDLENVWNTVWGGIKTAVGDAYNYIAPIINTIKTTVINGLHTAIQDLENAWNTVWGGIETAVYNAYNYIAPIINTIANAVRSVESTIGGLLGAAGISIPGFAEGGWVPGPPGAPMLAVVHGGEFVVSREMQNNSGPITASTGTDGVPEIHSYLYIDGQQLRGVVQRQTLRYNQRNATNGLALQAGR